MQDQMQVTQWPLHYLPEPEAKGLMGPGARPSEAYTEAETTPHQMLRRFASQHDKRMKGPRERHSSHTELGMLVKFEEDSRRRFACR